MSFIGIDLGATFLKGAWLNPEGAVLSAVHREPFPAFVPGLPAGRREVSAEAVVTAVKRLIEHLLAGHPGACAGLLLCGQMHGFVLTRLDGSAASDFISWQDSRCREANVVGGPSHFEIARAVLGDVLRAELGNEFRPGLPVTTLHAMSRRAELPAGTMPLGLMDFVASRLTGAEPATDMTNAAAHGLLNVARGVWHYEALSALELEGLLLPRIQSVFDPVGVCRLGSREFPVFTSIGDQQAALLGTHLLPGELSLNVATGSQVSVLTAHPQAGDWQLRPYFDGQWLRTITHLPAGRALNRLIHLCGELAADQGTPLRDPWEQVSRLAGFAGSGTLSADLAFFPTAYGERGAFTGILEDEISVGHFFRAAFRAMADNYARSAHRVAADGWTRVVFSGGLVQKLPVLRSEILDRLGGEHRFAPHDEDTLMGLLALSRKIHA